MIKSVRGLKIGDTVDSGEGFTAKVTSFPTRNMVCLNNPKPKSGQWSNAKLSLRELKYHKKTGWYIWRGLN